jgi:quercetin dioxygenase-like cupin family protein
MLMQLIGRGAIGMATSIVLSAGPAPSSQSNAADRPATVVIDNARVRVFRTSGPSRVGIDHRPGVVVPLQDSSTRRAGEAYWAADAAVPGGTTSGPLVIVEPGEASDPHPAAASGTKPGDAPFTGMSFRTLFENDRAAIIRARMDVGAREGFHTHAADTIVVHLSGGTIEDTADGITKVNRWTRGDVEFEARGSSHSARNLGPAVDVVLVTIRP